MTAARTPFIILQVSPEVGSSFAHYRLIGTMGKGGMADVYLAVGEGGRERGTLRVLKVLRGDLSDDHAFLDMFVDEARLASQLRHPNIVETTLVSEEAGRPFIAMEYIEGPTLHRLAYRFSERGDDIPVEVALQVALDVLDALRYAHELEQADGRPLGIVHRDVSPSNVLITYDGKAKLVDFGIAKSAVRRATTKAGIIKGKAGYMAPEQTEGRPVDCKADIYSLAVVLWELLAGERFPLEMLEVSGSVPALSRMRSDVPKAIDDVLCRALVADPQSRWPSAHAMAEGLRTVISDCGIRCARSAVESLVSVVFGHDRDETRAKVAAAMEAVQGGSGSVRTAPAVVPPTLVIRDSVPPEPTSVSLKPNREQQRAAKRGGVMVGAAGVLVAVCAVLIIRWGGLNNGAGASGTSGATGQPATAEQPEPAASVMVDLIVEPANAVIELDGQRLSGPRFQARLPAGERPHSLRVSAEGYRTSEREVRFERDTEMRVVLEPVSGQR